MERSEQVDVDDGFEAVRRQCLGWCWKITGGAGDQDVDRSERLARALDDAFERGVVADVGGFGEDRRADARSSAAAPSRRSCVRPQIAMLAPTVAKFLAIPRLIPLPPPVTKTVLPAKRSFEKISVMLTPECCRRIDGEPSMRRVDRTCAHVQCPFSVTIRHSAPSSRRTS